MPPTTDGQGGSSRLCAYTFLIVNKFWGLRADDPKIQALVPVWTLAVDESSKATAASSL